LSRSLSHGPSARPAALRDHGLPDRANSQKLPRLASDSRPGKQARGAWPHTALILQAVPNQARKRSQTNAWRDSPRPTNPLQIGSVEPTFAPSHGSAEPPYHGSALPTELRGRKCLQIAIYLNQANPEVFRALSPRYCSCTAKRARRTDGLSDDTLKSEEATIRGGDGRSTLKRPATWPARSGPTPPSALRWALPSQSGIASTSHRSGAWGSARLLGLRAVRRPASYG